MVYHQPETTLRDNSHIYMLEPEKSEILASLAGYTIPTSPETFQEFLHEIIESKDLDLLTKIVALGPAHGDLIAIVEPFADHFRASPEKADALIEAIVSWCDNDNESINGLINGLVVAQELLNLASAAIKLNILPLAQAAVRHSPRDIFCEYAETFSTSLAKELAKHTNSDFIESILKDYPDADVVKYLLLNLSIQMHNHELTDVLLDRQLCSLQLTDGEKAKLKFELDVRSEQESRFGRDGLFHPLVTAANIGNILAAQKILACADNDEGATPFGVDPAFRRACYNQDSALFELLTKSGADINCHQGIVLEDAIGRLSLASFLFLTSRGAKINVLHRQAVEQFEKPEDQNAKELSFLVLKESKFADSPSSLYQVVEETLQRPIRSLKSDAREIVGDKTNLSILSSHSLAIGALLGTASPGKKVEIFEQLFLQDILRVESTNGLSYRRYNEALRNYEFPLIEIRDMVKEFAEVIILPILARHQIATNKHQLDGLDIFTKRVLDNSENLQSEALQIAAEFLIIDKTSLDLRVLNAKWHRGDNRCPDSLRPGIAKLQWQPLFKDKIDLGDGFTIECLSSTDELKEEGSVLSHCVGSYAGKCQEGRTQILSLRDRESRVGTLEFVATDFGDIRFRDSDLKWEIRQFRGYGNTTPSARAQAAVDYLKSKINEGKVTLDPSFHLRTQALVHTFESRSSVEKVMGFKLSDSNYVRQELLRHYQERVALERGGSTVRFLSENGLLQLNRLIDSLNGQGENENF